MTHRSPKPPFLAGIETECLTTASREGEPCSVQHTAEGFLRKLVQICPSLPGPSGIFNPYGRVYLDGTHIEFASAESACPYALTEIVWRQQELASYAIQLMKQDGIDLLLSNINYSGLLNANAPTWGCHENYLVWQSPDQFADRILPFLATRIYAGSGAINYADMTYVSGARITRMSQERGGDTTRRRALHSVTHKESLAGDSLTWQRYHLLLGDGLRSRFGLSLRTGATLLVLAVVQDRPDLIAPIPTNCRLHQTKRSFWVSVARELNVLSRDWSRPTPNSIAIDVQRIYLDAVSRWRESIRQLPPWVDQIIEDWRSAMAAIETADHEWLILKLDPWIKYELLECVLRASNATWSCLENDKMLRQRLALAEQNHHMITEQAVIQQVISQRKFDKSSPTSSISGLPTLGTRADARAEFIQRNRHDQFLDMNWDAVIDRRESKKKEIYHPFARYFTQWK